jgi:hypothetical protein
VSFLCQAEWIFLAAENNLNQIELAVDRPSERPGNGRAKKSKGVSK